MNCLECHPDFKLAGTVFTDSDASGVAPGEALTLVAPDGSLTVLNNSDKNGNIHETVIGDGEYLVQIGPVKSRTWHNLPAQRACNSCHIQGGNGTPARNLVLPQYHTQVTAHNRCADCHHFPATKEYGRLSTASVLHLSSFIPEIPGSKVIIDGTGYEFDPSEYSISSVRPDIFAPGYFSMFDVILAVAEKNKILLDYEFDSTRMTHFITRKSGVEGDYWYHFSYDTGNGNEKELEFRRENRWDETLWRPGAWVRLVDNEELDTIKAHYLEEIERERESGHLIPQVRIRLNPGTIEGNPEGSGRITVNKLFKNVSVTPHNYRSTGFESPYSKPFQPGVTTSLDILLSLKDQGELTVVTGAFYTNFAGNYIDSYYVVEMGFPQEGIAHSSGRQGFTYTTGNGSRFTLAHRADNKFHITSDIAVLHAPDFSSWKWTELGNPYYEQEITSLNRSIIEDYNSIERGFNLFQPYPNPVGDGTLNISFNIFEPGMVSLAIIDIKGAIVEKLEQKQFENLGVHNITWKPNGIAAGQYCVRMTYENHQQVRRFNVAR